MKSPFYSVCMRRSPKPIHPVKLQKARELRHDLTHAERRAWAILRNRRLGFKFRRQHVIDGFIVDFYCHELRLAVEIDGAVHSDPKIAEYDAARTAHLQMRGLTVVRIANDRVSEESLRDLVQGLSDRSPSPRSGEGDRG